MSYEFDIDRAVGSLIDAFTLSPNDEDERRERVKECLLRNLAALSAAGRLRAEVAGEVVEAATQRVIATRYADIAKMPEGSAGRAAVESVRRDIAAAAPIIAADAERRVRAAVLEEAEQAIRCCGALDENGYFCEKAKAIAAIRALLTPSPAAQPEGER